MERYIEFAIRNWEWVLAFFVVLIALFVTERRKGGASVTPQQATTLINKDDAVVVDVRPRKEFDTGHIVNSVNIPSADIAKRAGELKKHQDKPVIVVCALGQTAGAAAKTLKEQGFNNVVRLGGGISEWKASNLPVVR
ncbi:rhodanese-like domain-containing protein [Pokkaliibacter sp. CJK22405]|uniref:rhodanese-like domain-containing protein n=1 Tax=Pokkaliibacter sp. CJK22405 TaxID=3384615 RepID=UPI003984F554